jgi:hypothetical protein
MRTIYERSDHSRADLRSARTRPDGTVPLAQTRHYASQIEQIANLHHFAMSSDKGLKE